MTDLPLLMQQPDTPLTETWNWVTDTYVSDNGTEQRMQLISAPRRQWAGTFVFDDMPSIRAHMAGMFSDFMAVFNWPNWAYVIKCKRKHNAGVSTIYANPFRAPDLRSGGKAIIIEGTTFEVVVIDAIFDDRFTIIGVTENNYSPRALVCPLIAVYSADAAAFSRAAPNKVATAAFTFFENITQDALILDDAKVDLTMFDGLPVFEKRATGAQFDMTLSTGMTIDQYNPTADLRARWKNPQWQFVLMYLSERWFDPVDWYYLLTFLDWCRGSAVPFYMPTWRDDFDTHVDAAHGDTTLVLAGTEYGDNYWPVESFRQIMFTNAADDTVHYASITARAVVGGNDSLTFTPTLPVGDWTGQTIGLLLLCRIADDIAVIEHDGPTSIVTLNIRTTDG